MGVNKIDKRVIKAGGFETPDGRSVTAAATTTVAGTVKKAALVANAAGANPTKAEYDALLAALKTAGIMSTT
jgi:hypothetical protein